MEFIFLTPLVWYSPVVAAIVKLDDAIVLVRNKDRPKWDSWIFFPNILREHIREYLKHGKRQPV